MQANGRRGILSVLRVWSLANGRLARPNNRGLRAKLGVLHAGVARVGLVGVPFPCGAGRTCRGCGAFGTFEAWQMAALNAYKRSHCCGRGVPFPCGVGQTFGGVGRFGGLRLRKRQPIKEAIAAAVGCSWAIAVALWWSHCCGRGVPFPCGVGQTFGGVGRLGGFEASQTAAYKRSHCCGRGVLLSHCGGLVVAFACSVGVARVQERQDPHLRWSQAPPRPWRRPGSADKKWEIDCQRMATVRVKMTISHRISWGFGVPGVYCFRQTHVKFNC